MKKNDFTISVIKSIKPITFSYSKQGKDYEKYFSSSNLVHLLKSIDKKAKINTVFNSNFLQNKEKSDKNFININIKSSFNYIKDLSSLNNFPISMVKQRKNYEEYLKKMHLFNELFYVKKDKLVDMESRKKRAERIKQKFESQKINNENDVTLDPGKYHPKYDIILKRYPVAFIGRSNDEDKKNSNSKIKIIIKENENKKINNSSDVIYQNNSKPVKNKNEKNKYLSYKKINPSLAINKSISEKKFPTLEKIKINNLNNRTISKKLYPNKNRKINLKENRKSKSKLFSMSSSDNINKIRCPIVFNRMPGRDRNVVIMPNCRDVDYSPNYEIIRPHAPQITFKNKFDLNKFKKFMTGKIIRSYCLTPDKYFVFEMSENKN